MKKIIFIILAIQHTLIYASESIDRMGWHTGIGLSDMVWDDVLKYHLYIPQLDAIVDYGITPQITLGLEHRGILFGYTSADLKYYLTFFSLIISFVFNVYQ